MEDSRRYPVGRYKQPEKLEMETVKQNIARLREFPGKLSAAVGKLSKEQLGTKTIPGHWTIAQVVNHLADSHMNMIVRVKLALTEDNPAIVPYNETLWSRLGDGMDTDINDSLAIINSVHRKLTCLLEGLSMDDLRRTYYHPEDKQNYAIGIVTSLYAWHGDHHLGHISEVIEIRNW